MLAWLGAPRLSEMPASGLGREMTGLWVLSFFRARRPCTYFILKMAVSQEQKPWGAQRVVSRCPQPPPPPPRTSLPPSILPPTRLQPRDHLQAVAPLLTAPTAPSETNSSQRGARRVAQSQGGRTKATRGYLWTLGL